MAISGKDIATLMLQGINTGIREAELIRNARLQKRKLDMQEKQFSAGQAERQKTFEESQRRYDLGRKDAQEQFKLKKGSAAQKAYSDLAQQKMLIDRMDMSPEEKRNVVSGFNERLRGINELYGTSYKPFEAGGSTTNTQTQSFNSDTDYTDGSTTFGVGQSSYMQKPTGPDLDYLSGYEKPISTSPFETTSYKPRQIDFRNINRAIMTGRASNIQTSPSTEFKGSFSQGTPIGDKIRQTILRDETTPSMLENIRTGSNTDIIKPYYEAIKSDNGLDVKKTNVKDESWIEKYRKQGYKIVPTLPGGITNFSGNSVTRKELLDLFNERVKSAEQDVRQFAGSNLSSLPDQLKVDLVSTAYNVGRSGLNKFKGVREAIQQNNPVRAYQELIDSRLPENRKNRFRQNLANLRNRLRG